MNKPLEFNHQKATQALNLLAIFAGGKIDKLKAIKLIWLADRYHLRRYGRLITNDCYLAMPLGPVPSSVKDIAELSDFLSSGEKVYAQQYLCPESNVVCSVRNVDESVFSTTDLEALHQVFETYGKIDQFSLAEYSHTYPEWLRFKDALESGLTTREWMLYEDFFQDPERGNASLFQQSQAMLEQSKENFQENFAVDQFWSS